MVLDEKINLPMINIVQALMQGLESGAITAYHPDDYNLPMSYDEVLARMQAFDNVWSAKEDIQEYELIEEPDDLLSEFDFPEENGPETAMATTSDEGFGTDFMPYESVLQFVEDRIFDKRRSELSYQIQYVQLIWSDPGETLPEKYFVVLNYEEIEDYLDTIKWKNRFNDAEDRSVKEIFELRLFHSYVTNVSGLGVKTLSEAEDRRQQLVAYEHHLWSY